jgi:hypothetical protein
VTTLPASLVISCLDSGCLSPFHIAGGKDTPRWTSKAGGKLCQWESHNSKTTAHLNLYWTEIIKWFNFYYVAFNRTLPSSLSHKRSWTIKPTMFSCTHLLTVSVAILHSWPPLLSCF